MSFRVLSLVVLCLATVSSALAAATSDKRVTTKERFREVIASQLKKNQEFTGLANENAFSSEYRIRTMKELSVEASRDYKLAANYLAHRKTSTVLRAHFNRIGLLLGNIPANIQPSTLSEAGRISAEIEAELQLIQSQLN